MTTDAGAVCASRDGALDGFLRCALYLLATHNPLALRQTSRPRIHGRLPAAGPRSVIRAADQLFAACAILGCANAVPSAAAFRLRDFVTQLSPWDRSHVFSELFDELSFRLQTCSYKERRSVLLLDFGLV